MGGRWGGNVLNLPHDNILTGASSGAEDDEEAVVPCRVVTYVLPEEVLDIFELCWVLEEVEAADEPLSAPTPETHINSYPQ